MSTSTNAIFAYGFCLDEDFKLPWGNRDWDDVLLEKLDIQQSDFYTYTEFLNAQKKMLDKYGAMIDVHNSCDYPQHAVVITASQTVAYRGTPKLFRPAHFLIKDDWVQRLIDFCELMALPFSEPSWLMYSLWC